MMSMTVDEMLMWVHAGGWCNLGLVVVDSLRVRRVMAEFVARVMTRPGVRVRIVSHPQRWNDLVIVIQEDGPGLGVQIPDNPPCECVYWDV